MTKAMDVLQVLTGFRVSFRVTMKAIIQAVHGRSNGAELLTEEATFRRAGEKSITSG